MIFLGIDPGIANTGLAIVEMKNGRYELVKARSVRSTPKEIQTERLLKIYNQVVGILTEFDVEAVAIEKVFHNQNVSSSITTGKAIGAAMLGAAAHGKKVLELTPQQIKRASGLSLGEADKSNLTKMASRIFRAKITNHHIADAAFCALAGILKRRSRR